MSKPDQLFCTIRKRWITATPEEKIRQFYIQHMVENLCYPLNSIILEKNLNQLPHLDPSAHALLPTRRIDLLLLAKDLHPRFPFYPLLLIECKATPLNDKAMRQLMGYNHYLQACFVALANQQELRLGWMDPVSQIFQMSSGLPPYELLLKQAAQIIRLI